MNYKDRPCHAPIVEKRVKRGVALAVLVVLLVLMLARVFQLAGAYYISEELIRIVRLWAAGQGTGGGPFLGLPEA